MTPVLLFACIVLALSPSVAVFVWGLWQDYKYTKEYPKSLGVDIPTPKGPSVLFLHCEEKE